MDSEVGAVLAGAVLDEQLESVRLEDAGVVGEEAEEDPHQETLQLVAGITAGFKGIVESAHDVDGLEVDRVLVFKAVLLVAGDEPKGVDLLVQLREGKFQRADPPAIDERQVLLLLRLQIVQRDAREVRDDDVARDLVLPPLADQMPDVA